MTVVSAYLGKHTAIVRTIYGQKMFLDTRDLGIVPHLLLDGFWESWITEAIRPYLRNSIVFDVGANVGWYSLLAAQEGAKKIVAFEPCPETFQLLVKTMQVNGISCDLHEKAVVDSEKWGATILKHDPQWSGSSSCLEDVSVKAKPISVPTTTLDSVFSQLLSQDESLADHRVALKIDVEGFEPRVVAGAREVLSRDCTAFVEYHADPKGKTGLVGMLDYFESGKYQLNHVNHDSNILPVTREGLAGLPDAEMLCFRKF